MSNRQAGATPQADEIVETARHLFGLSGSSWEQFRRYATEHLAWCEFEGVEIPADNDARARYRAYLEAVGKVSAPRHWTLRATAINKLPTVIAEIQRQASTAASPRRTRHIDALPAGSELRQAIEAIVGDASRSYRASLRADIAVFLEWCRDSAVDPVALDLAGLANFEQWLTNRGRRSRGPRSAARRLWRDLHRPEPWWR